MNSLLSEFGRKIKETCMSMDPNAAMYKLTSSVDLPNIVAFYAASMMFGYDILEYENETIELGLLQRRVSPTLVKKATYTKALIADMDGVLSMATPFKLAVELFNDHEPDAAVFEHRPTHEIIWTIINLMAIYNADNIPLTGDALKYAAACMINDGWTMPPYMVNERKFGVFFPFFDESYYESIQCSNKELMLVCSSEANGVPRDAQVNFMAMHKPIMAYLNIKINEIKRAAAASV